LISTSERLRPIHHDQTQPSFDNTGRVGSECTFRSNACSFFLNPPSQPTIQGLELATRAILHLLPPPPVPTKQYIGINRPKRTRKVEGIDSQDTRHQAYALCKDHIHRLPPPIHSAPLDPQPVPRNRKSHPCPTRKKRRLMSKDRE